MMPGARHRFCYLVYFRADPEWRWIECSESQMKDHAMKRCSVLLQFQMERRFGCTAVKKGYITEDQLAEAMMIQLKEDLALGKHRQIGQILLSLGYIDDQTIVKVLDALDLSLSIYNHYIGVTASTAGFIKAG